MNLSQLAYLTKIQNETFSDDVNREEKPKNGLSEVLGL